MMMIGGPNTLMPRWFESFLSWILALSCLSVAFYHYYIDTLYLYHSNSNGNNNKKLSLLLPSFVKQLFIIPTLLLTKEEEDESEEENEEEESEDEKEPIILIPLTTHSRREWLTVSESYKGYLKRCNQLYSIIENDMNFNNNNDNNDDDNDNDNNNDNDNDNDNDDEVVKFNSNLSKWLLSSPIGAELFKYTTSSSSFSDETTYDNNNKMIKEKKSDEYKDRSNKYYKPLVQLIRTNNVARRLTSLLLSTDPIDIYNNNSGSKIDKIGTISFMSSSSEDDFDTSSSLSVSKRKKEWRYNLFCSSSSRQQQGQKKKKKYETASLLLLSTLIKILQHIWPQLLKLPNDNNNNENNNDNNDDNEDDNNDCNDDNSKNYKYDISLIVPSYHEDPNVLGTKLKRSIDNMIFITNKDNNNNEDDNNNNNKVEIIIVHCIDIDVDVDVDVDVDDDSSSKEISSSSSSSNSSSSTVLFTDTLKRKLCLLEDNDNNKNNNKSKNITLRVIQYKDGGGRGPCLNYGALHSKGKILTFLHADTYLNKKGWNNAIINAFNGCCDDNNKNNNNNNNNDNNNKNPKTRIITCCAFSFAIEKSTTLLQGIPGINAIEVTANIRTKLFKLPYGDQCISIPSIIFNYIGGYPDQCLIEDYELIRLLRLRSSYSKNNNNNNNNNCHNTKDYETEEEIQILPDNYKAVCSPRRWEKLGVLYTTYTNSYIIKRYNSGIVTPDELFYEYYGGNGNGNGNGSDKNNNNNNNTSTSGDRDEEVVEKGPKRKYPTKSPWEISISI